MLQHRSASSSRLSLDFPDLPGKPAYTLKPGQPSPGQHSLLRPPFAVTPSTGILTCFPSTTPFGLALGPDLPREDEPSPGTLSQSVCGILTHISLLTPAFSLPYAPVLLPVYLQCCMERSPTTYVYTQIHRFGTALSPG